MLAAPKAPWQGQGCGIEHCVLGTARVCVCVCAHVGPWPRAGSQRVNGQQPPTAEALGALQLLWGSAPPLLALPGR